MYLKLHYFIHCLIAMALALTVLAAANSQTPVQKPAVKTATVHGHIADPTGALLPGAKISVTTAAGTVVASTTADSGGAYTVTGLAAGSYLLHADSEGFAPVSSPAIQVAAGQVKRVDISMATVVEQQSVTVTDEEAPMVSVEASGNTSSIVLKDKDLDALSDDPDELSSELTALAGPSAGPNGGEVYISGFTGGQLPPKSAIREIRINQNPYSSEFDHLGYGRIEILTKPGTDQLHGRFFVQGNDDAFNTGNPFTTSIPAYHSIQYNGSISGSISKSASYFLSVEERNNQNASIYSVTTAVLNPTTNVYSAGTVSGGLFSPSTHTEVSPRVDLQIGQKNTLTLRYQFERYSQSGGISSLQLPSQSSTSTSIEHTIQLSDSQVINDHIVNETRFQYLRDLDSSTPVSTAPTVSVPGSFIERRLRRPTIQRSHRSPGVAEPDHHVGRRTCHQVRHAPALQSRCQLDKRQLQRQLQLSLAECIRRHDELALAIGPDTPFCANCRGRRPAQQAQLHDWRYGRRGQRV